MPLLTFQQANAIKSAAEIILCNKKRSLQGQSSCFCNIFGRLKSEWPLHLALIDCRFMAAHVLVWKTYHCCYFSSSVMVDAGQNKGREEEEKGAGSSVNQVLHEDTYTAPFYQYWAKGFISQIVKQNTRTLNVNFSCNVQNVFVVFSTKPCFPF